MVEQLRNFQPDREKTGRSRRAVQLDNHLEYRFDNDELKKQIDVKQDRENLQVHQRAVKLVFKYKSNENYQEEKLVKVPYNS